MTQNDARWIVWSLLLSVIGGWGTHIYVCLSAGKWGFLIAGALFVPVGVVHGWGIWFGVW